ncbi:MAG: WG repeat-containing protein [Saprospiraceae bacterium]|nr:WG repeat-containing protein [Saprospiraceae bacterium]
MLLKQTVLFIITLTISGLISCKNEASSVTKANSAVEAAWLEDYEKSPFVWGFVDPTGHFVILPKYDELRDFSEGLAACNYGGKWGFLDTSGRDVIAQQYLTCADFSSGRALVQDFNQHYYYIDKTGQKLFACPGIECSNFCQGFAFYSSKDMWGVLDGRGKTLIEPQFMDIRHGYEGQFIVKLGQYYGLIDTHQQWIINAKFDDIKVANDDKYIVKSGKEAKLVDKTGKMWLKNISHSSVFLDDFCIVQNKKGFHIITSEGEEKYTTTNKLTPLGAQRFAEWEGSKAFIINSEGRRQTKMSYDGFLMFSEGRVGALRGDYWTYVSLDGKEILEPILPLAWDCKEGRIRYVTQNGYGFMDADGRPIIEAQYPEARDFSGSLARMAIFR